MYILLCFFSVFIASLAQMLLKKGAQTNNISLIKQYLNIWVVSGYSILLLSLIINIYILSKGVMIKEISIIESFSYLFVPLLSWIFFKEKVNLRKFISIILILLGVIVFFI